MITLRKVHHGFRQRAAGNDLKPRGFGRTSDWRQELSIVDATVADLESALSHGHTNSVELTAKHLLRIATYDRRSTLLNSIPLINEDVFEAAQASDSRRAAGIVRSALDGIPCTIKDSYKIRGMPVAAGSHAFKNLIANEDAFTVALIKEAGAVVLGRTNMPPMAAGDAAWRLRPR